MQLHRAKGNDWDSVPLAERTAWQRTAASTAGLISPGNIVTAAGGVLVSVGLIMLSYQRNAWLAVGFLLVGRLADLLDGLVADWTGTKSPVGEAMDATVDKMELVLAAVVIWALQLLPAVVFIVVLVHTFFNIGMYIAAHYAKARLHPSRSGKLAAAAEWIAIGLFVLVRGIPLHGSFSHLTTAIAWAWFVGFVICALPSSLAYFADLGEKRRGTS